MINHDVVVLAVQPRPSDPTELVAILDSQDAPEAFGLPMTADQVEAAFAANPSAVVTTTAEVLGDYIESPAAMRRGHLFLTL